MEQEAPKTPRELAEHLVKFEFNNPNNHMTGAQLVDLYTQWIENFIHHTNLEARIDEIKRVISSGRANADGFGHRAILVDSLEVVLRNRIAELMNLANLKAELAKEKR